MSNIWYGIENSRIAPKLSFDGEEFEIDFIQKYFTDLGSEPLRIKQSFGQAPSFTIHLRLLNDIPSLPDCPPKDPLSWTKTVHGDLISYGKGGSFVYKGKNYDVQALVPTGKLSDTTPSSFNTLLCQMTTIGRSWNNKPNIKANSNFTQDMGWSFWLCGFVLPSSRGDLVRAEVIPMACNISQGISCNLAVLVLTHLYYQLGRFASMEEPGKQLVQAPFQYLCGWIAMHYHRTYARRVQLAKGMPFLACSGDQRLSNMDRLIGELFRDKSEFVHRPYEKPFEANEIIDFAIGKGQRISKEHLSFLIFVRPGILTYRFGRNSVAKPYAPSRYSREHGFTQVQPPPLPSAEHRNIPLIGPKHQDGLEYVTESYAKWWQHSTRAIISFRPSPPETSPSKKRRSKGINDHKGLKKSPPVSTKAHILSKDEILDRFENQYKVFLEDLEVDFFYSSEPEDPFNTPSMKSARIEEGAMRGVKRRMSTSTVARGRAKISCKEKFPSKCIVEIANDAHNGDTSAHLLKGRAPVSRGTSDVYRDVRNITEVNIDPQTRTLSDHEESFEKIIALLDEPPKKTIEDDFSRMEEYLREHTRMIQSSLAKKLVDMDPLNPRLMIRIANTMLKGLFGFPLDMRPFHANIKDFITQSYQLAKAKEHKDDSDFGLKFREA
ncbi:hypothetical protein RJ639_011023 [Escallonia herrerae]|uniref:Aminotransferase-like plant mobile domain-containing protein n=1 Tax=Escallonia herrerae TaxID=1293975 RepID=A0AA88VL31_9ASTE|nr:hypothetical protein RJ639_011023 [Escallonia herrerae]